MRTPLFAIVLIALSGCANPPKPFYGVTQAELKSYTEKILAVEQTGQDSNRDREPRREYDPSKPVRYWMQSGEKPKVWVYVPLREKDGSGYSYAAWRVDVQSEQIDGSGWIPNVEP